MGMTGAAGEMVSSGAASRETLEELLICMFQGAIAALRETYGRG